MKTLCVVKITVIVLAFCTLLPDSTSGQEPGGGVAAIPISFHSEGSLLAGSIFPAASDTLVPVMIILNGYPGTDGDIRGIGGYVSRHGICACVFNYRGSWKSEGDFSIEHAVSDVRAAVDFAKLPEISARYQIDTNRIILCGYSLGGGIALLGGKSCPSVSKIVSFGTTNLRVTAEKIERDSVYRKAHLRALEKPMSPQPIIRCSMGPAALHETLIRNKAIVDLFTCVDDLKEKKILLIGGWRDRLAPVEEHIIPLFRMFQQTKNAQCTVMMLDADHSFGDALSELHEAILTFTQK